MAFSCETWVEKCFFPSFQSCFFVRKKVRNNELLLSCVRGAEPGSSRWGGNVSYNRIDWPANQFVNRASVGRGRTRRRRMEQETETKRRTKKAKSNLIWGGVGVVLFWQPSQEMIDTFSNSIVFLVQTRSTHCGLSSQVKLLEDDFKRQGIFALSIKILLFLARNKSPPHVVG